MKSEDQEQIVVADRDSNDSSAFNYNKFDVILESCGHLQGALQLILQKNPEKADDLKGFLLPTLHSFCVENGDLEIKNLWSTLKSCVEMAGVLLLERNYKVARALHLTAMFLYDVANVRDVSLPEKMKACRGYNNASRLLLCFPNYKRICDILPKAIHLLGPEDFVAGLLTLAKNIHVNHPDTQWIEKFRSLLKIGKAFLYSHIQQTQNRQTWITVNVEDRDGKIKYEIEILARTLLDDLLSAYWCDCRVPKKICRHSCVNGRVLLRGQHGNMPLYTLGIQDGSLLKVGSHIVETTGADRQPNPATNNKQTQKGKNSKGKKNKSKKNIQRRKSSGLVLERTLQDYKDDHSKMLSRVFDETRDVFDGIRKELNDQEIKKTKPKKRVPRFISKGNENESNPGLPFIDEYECNAGKAGKAVYPILVGEEAFLYKTGKGNAYKKSESKVITLDLHGCTRTQALEKLNESLPKWLDKAMKGNYPYVIMGNIVCGGGNQVLSDVVKRWIADNRNVAHRPNGHF